MRIIGILFLAAERDGRLGVWTVHVFFLTYLMVCHGTVTVCEMVFIAGGLEKAIGVVMWLCGCIVTVVSLQVAVDQIRDFGPEAEGMARASEGYIPNGRMG
jgi:hypothetical protein